MIPKLMTINEFYMYQIVWYVFATIVAFIAAVLFWKRGSSATEGRIPELPVSWKLTGAGAIFVVVLLVFFVINPLKPLTDYKKILIVSSTQDFPSSPTGTGIQYKMMPSQISADSIHFDLDTLHVQMIPVKFIYELSPELADNSFVTHDVIPKGKYKIRFVSFKTGESKEFLVDVK